MSLLSSFAFPSAAAVVLSLMALVAAAPAAPRPNIVVIVVDDMGWNDLGANPRRDPSSYAHGPEEVATPNMDRIAASGVVFTQAYSTSPICSASRAGWNTGVHQNRWNPKGGWSPGLGGRKTLAARLKASGYLTGRVGKNDFGETRELRSPKGPMYPANHGYDFYLGFTGHAHDYWFHTTGGHGVDGSTEHAGPFQFHDLLADPSIALRLKAYTGADDPANLDGDPGAYYISDLLTDEANGFVSRAVDSGKPFYLTISYSAIHHLSPQVPGKYLEAEAARLNWSTTPPEAEQYDPASDTPRNPANYGEYYRYWNSVKNIGVQDMRKYYLANLRCLDFNIGRVLDTLKEKGVARDTLVVCFSDNGAAPETGANNGPLMGSKYNVFEGGIRVPFMIRWPAGLPQAAVYDHLVSTLDIVPTCLEAAGVEEIPEELDGLPLLDAVAKGRPTVAAESDPNTDERTLFWRWLGDNYAVRKGKWKLIKSGKSRSGTFTDQVYFDDTVVGKRSLFDMGESPREIGAKDKIDRHPEQAEVLQALYNEWINNLN